MTKMAAMPIYGKTLKNLLQNRWADFHEIEEVTKMLMKIFISYNFKNLCILHGHVFVMVALTFVRDILVI